jgi:predicted membrane-bound mannosyltransferase
LAVATPLIAAGFGVGELVRTGRADKAVRAVVLEAARENGLWVVIATGVGAAEE